MIILADDAAALSRVFYDELDEEYGLDLEYKARSFIDPDLRDKLSASARFALSQDATESFLEGTGVRAIHNTARDTLIGNVDEEGGKWYRIPREDACGFCRILASRGAVYHTEVKAKASHDKCKCGVAVERPGMSLERPEYMRSWDDDYRRHRRLVIDAGESPEMNTIANSWNNELFRLGIRERSKHGTPTFDVGARDVA